MFAVAFSEGKCPLKGALRASAQPSGCQPISAFPKTGGMHQKHKRSLRRVYWRSPKPGERIKSSIDGKKLSFI